MRCIACDKNLNDFESTRKDLHGNYIDMCNECYGDIKDVVLAIEREDLNRYETITEDEVANVKLEEYVDE